MADDYTEPVDGLEQLQPLGAPVEAPQAQPSASQSDPALQGWEELRRKRRGSDAAAPAPVETQPDPNVGLSPLAQELERDGWIGQLAAQNAAEREAERQEAARQSTEAAQPGMAERAAGVLREAPRWTGVAASQIPGGAIAGAGSVLQAPDVVVATSEQTHQAERLWKLEAINATERGETAPISQTGDPYRDAQRNAFLVGLRRASPQDRARYRAAVESEVAAYNPTPIQDRPLYRAGEAVQEYGRTLVPLPEGYDEQSFSVQVGRGLGSMLVGLPVSAVAGPVGGAVVFGSMGMGEATQRAVEFDKHERAAGRSGLSQDQIILAGLLGVGPGTTDILPVETLLGRLALPLPPILRTALARSIARVGGQALVEGAQEGGQQFLQNVIAWQVYNPNQELTQEVIGNLLVGGGVGAVAETAKEIATPLMRLGGRRGGRGASQPAPAETAAPQSAAPAAPPEAAEPTAPAAPAEPDPYGLGEIAAPAPAAPEAAPAAAPAEAPAVAPEAEAAPAATPATPEAAPAVQLPPDVMEALRRADPELAARYEAPAASTQPETDGPREIVTPDGGMRVQAAPEIVDLATLTAASGALQPRDRSRAESQTAIRQIAAGLDPEQLMPSRVSDSGAPIVDASGTVISGNGRVEAIRQAYADPALRARADAYRASLGPQAEGMAMPVRVMRLPQMEQAELQRFADLSNRSRIGAMSATERAQRDAAAAGSEVMGLYQGGAFTAPANQEFFRAFTGGVVSEAERGAFSREGQLTREGEQRMASAVLAAAYGDADLLSRMLESTDDNIRSLTGALQDASSAFIRMKEAIRVGEADAKFDITPQVVEAVRRVADLRDRNIRPDVFLAQQDAFTQIDPVVEGLIRAFYNDALSRQLSRQKISELLTSYAEEAAKHRAEGLIPDETTPEQIVAFARERAVREDTLAERLARSQGDIFARPAAAEPDVAPSGPSLASRPDAGDGREGEGRGAPERGAEARATGAAAAQPVTEPTPAQRTQLRGIIASRFPLNWGTIQARLGATPEQMETMRQEALSEGILRLDRNGAYRRTPQGVTSQAGPELSIPPEERVEGAIRALGKQVSPAVRAYGVELLSRLGFPSFMATLERAKADGSLKPADARDLAAIAGTPVANRASKATAFASIEKRHNDHREFLEKQAADTSLRVELAALQSVTTDGQSQKAELDALGFYSKALEAAKSWPQKKGAPDQALQHILKAGSGVKNEIEANGLRAFLEGKKSVTRDEIVSYLTQNRVEVREAVYGEWRVVLPDGTERTFDSLGAANKLSYETGGQIVGEKTKWRQHSLARDDSNPSYRETVLHLPRGETPALDDASTAVYDYVRARGVTHEQAYELLEEIGAAEGARNVNLSNLPAQANTPELHGLIARTTEAVRTIPYFQSGHFPEPNVIGNIMSSLNKLGDKTTFAVSQIQSDWAQNIRDATRDAMARQLLDPSKPEVKARIAELQGRLEEAHKQREVFLLGEPLAWLRSIGPELGVSGDDAVTPDNVASALNYVTQNAWHPRIQQRAGLEPEALAAKANGFLSHERNSAPYNILQEISTLQIRDKRFRELPDNLQAEVSAAISEARQRGELPAGARDEKKIAELRKVRDEAARRAGAERAAAVEGVGAEMHDFVSIHGKMLGSRYLPFHGGGVGVVVPDQADLDTLANFFEKVNSNGLDLSRAGHADIFDAAKPIYQQWLATKSKLDAAVDNVRLREAELRTAEAATPSHPFVNTTDQWLTTTLRHVVNQAIAAGADSISIPSGDTVLEYNSQGSEEGNDEFYNKIVPISLGKILKGYDPSIKPARVETVQSPVDGRELGKGFTVFPITDKVREKVQKQGQSLFALRGRGSGEWTGSYTEEFASRFPAASSALEGEFLRMLPRDAAVRLADRLTVHGHAAHEIVSGPFSPPSPFKWLLSVALSDGPQIAKLKGFHGIAAHILRGYGKNGLYTEQEWQILLDRARKTGAQKDLEGERVGDLIHVMSTEPGQRVETVWEGKKTTYTAKEGDVLVTNMGRDGKPLKDRDGYASRYLTSLEDLQQQYEGPGPGPIAVDPRLGQIWRPRMSLWEAYREAYAQYGLARRREFLDQELVARLAENWATGTNYGTKVNSLLERISKFLDAIRNWANGLGFQTADDVLQRAVSGEIARRLEGGRREPTFTPFPNTPSPTQVHVASEEGQEALDLFPAIRAFHGSPHDFDRFDITKIGTGEGAQAFGHGLYFAEAEGVARSYRDTLSSPARVRIDPKSMKPQDIALAFFRAVGKQGGASHAERMARNYPEDAEAYLAAAEIIRNGDPYAGASPGRLYEVSLDVEPEQLLDWDKPLGEQSEKVRDWYNKRVAPGLKTREIGNNPNLGPLTDVIHPEGGSLGVFTADKLQDVLSNPAKYAPAFGQDLVKGQEAALREAGIAGIRYKDAGSRGQEGGTSNFVIFDDNLVKIVAKDGKPVDQAERANVLQQMHQEQEGGQTNLAALASTPPTPSTRPFSVPGFDGSVTEKVKEGGERLRTYSAGGSSFIVSEQPDGSWELTFFRADDASKVRATVAAIEQDIGKPISPRGWLSPQGFSYWQQVAPDKVKFHVNAGDLFGGMYASPRAVEFAEAILTEAAKPQSVFQRGAAAVKRFFEPEYPVVAAVRYNGVIYEGPVHAVAFEKAQDAGATVEDVRAAYLASNEDFNGFVTNKGRFVGRIEASKLANKIGFMNYEGYFDAADLDVLPQLLGKEPSGSEDTRLTEASSHLSRLKSSIPQEAFQEARREERYSLASQPSPREPLTLRPERDPQEEKGSGGRLSIMLERLEYLMGRGARETIERAVDHEKLQDKRATKNHPVPSGLSHKVGMFRGSRKIGYVEYVVSSANPDTAYITFIANTDLYFRPDDAPWSLSDLRQFREEFRKLHPLVKRFEGQRISGAKASATDNFQSIYLASFASQPSLDHKVDGQDEAEKLWQQRGLIWRQKDTGAIAVSGERFPATNYRNAIALAGVLSARTGQAVYAFKTRGPTTLDGPAFVWRYSLVEPSPRDVWGKAHRVDGGAGTPGAGVSAGEEPPASAQEGSPSLLASLSGAPPGGPQLPITPPSQQVRGLSDIISDLKSALGLTTTQGLYGMRVRDRAGNRTWSFRPQQNIRGQYDANAGVARIRIATDIDAIAHEGGRHIERVFGAPMQAFQQAHSEELAVPAAPDMPLPPLNPTGYSGLELDADTQRVLVEAATNYRAWQAMASGSTRNAVAFRDATEQAAIPVALLRRRLGTTIANALVADLVTQTARPAADYVAERYSPTGTPAPRVATTPTQAELSNGFAAFFQRYVTDPDAVKREMPGTYTAFEDFLDANDPAMLQDLERVQVEVLSEDYKAYREATAVERGAADVATMQPEGLGERLADWYQSGRTWGGRWDLFKNWLSWVGSSLSYEMTDRTNPILKTQQALLRVAYANGVRDIDGRPISLQPGENAHRIARMQSGADKIGHQFITHGVPDYQGLEPVGPSLHEALVTALGGTRVFQWSDAAIRRFGLYLEARRAVAEWPRFMADEIGQPTRRDLAENQRIITELEAANPSYRQAAQMVYDWQHRLLTLEYQAGKWDKRAYDELTKRKDFYVPFMRDLSDLVPMAGAPPGTRMARRFAEGKRFQGSQRDIINPIESLIKRAHETAAAIQFNDMVKALANLSERAGPGGADFVERVQKEEVLAANQRTFDRIREEAIRLGIDPADAHMIVQKMELNFTDANVSLLWDPDNLGPQRPPIVPLWENGERKLVRLNDPVMGRRLFDAMNALGREQTNIWIRAIGYPSAVLRAGVTMHPAFIISNLLADMQAAWALTGAPPVITQAKGLWYLAATNPAINAIMRTVGITPPRIADLYATVGGISGGQNTAAIRALSQEYDLHSLRQRGFSVTSLPAFGGALAVGAGAAVGGIIGGPVGATLGASAGAIVARVAIGEGAERFFARLTEASETATRLGVAAHAAKRARKLYPNMSDIDVIREAAFTARDVIDFDRAGARAGTLLKLIPFLNSNLQGVSKAYRQGLLMEGDRGRVNMEKVRLFLRWQLTGTGAFRQEVSARDQQAIRDGARMWVNMMIMAAAGTAIAFMFSDEPEYDDVRKEVRNTHYVFKLWGIWYRIKKPFELAQFANMSEAFYEWMFRNDPRLMGRIWESFRETHMPPIVPQGYNLVTGWWTGVDAGRPGSRDPRPIVPEGLSRLPPAEQYNAYTSAFALAWSRQLHALGLNISPMMIDWTLNNELAYWGREVRVTSDYFFSERAPQWTDTPIAGTMLNRFTHDPSRSSESVQEFWALMGRGRGEFDEAYAGYDAILKRGNPNAATAYLAGLSPEERTYAVLQRHFSGIDQSAHPLNRANIIYRVNSGMRREMAEPGGLISTDPANRGESIPLPPAKRAEIDNILGRLSAIEAWDALHAIGRPGWGERQVRDPQPVLDELRAASEPAYEEMMRRRQRPSIVGLSGRVSTLEEDMRRWREVEERVNAMIRDENMLGTAWDRTFRRRRAPTRQMQPQAVQ